MTEYRSANYPLELPLELSPRTQVMRWSPLPTVRYKIKVDGAVFKTQKSARIGVLIWDEQDQVVTALSQNINAPLGALKVEAKAVEAGLHFARDAGISNFILKGDSLGVYNALSGPSSLPSSVASVISGILDFCGVLGQVDFSHIHRQGNTPAHLLAKHVVGIVDYLVWMEETPYFLMQALNHDVSFSM